jgi:hypothetical protein
VILPILLDKNHYKIRKSTSFPYSIMCLVRVANLALFDTSAKAEQAYYSVIATSLMAIQTHMLSRSHVLHCITGTPCSTSESTFCEAPWHVWGWIIEYPLQQNAMRPLYELRACVFRAPSSSIVHFVQCADVDWKENFCFHCSVLLRFRASDML